MSRRTASLEFRKSGVMYVSDDPCEVELCVQGFLNYAIPSWEGRPPRAMRLHVTRTSRGKWEWDRARVLDEIMCPDGELLETRVELDDWFAETFGTQQMRFNLEMEILKP